MHQFPLQGGCSVVRGNAVLLGRGQQAASLLHPTRRACAGRYYHPSEERTTANRRPQRHLRQLPHHGHVRAFTWSVSKELIFDEAVFRPPMKGQFSLLASRSFHFTGNA
ncbi:hypothetical protein TNCV_4771551 [Trichonephila clavipes]|nr:hypothetical protein TNCV_4771551 [Trichonephila clavipes]